jgi:hypothetical protein
MNICGCGELVERYRQGTNYSEKNRSQCHVFHHKSHIDRTEIDTVPPRFEAGE